MTASARQAMPGSLIQYQDDLYGWARQQSKLLEAGEFSNLDLANLADEIANVGNEQFDKLESALRILLMHLLKWDHQPEMRSRSWVATIREQRRRVGRVLRKNPSLKSAFDDALFDAYEDARDEASGETDIELERFPERCPYTRDEFMNRPVDWLIDK